MTIDILPLGDYQANCYIISEGDGCIAIDPGAEAQRLREYLDPLRLDAIFLTHGHFDHVGAVEALAKEAGCPVYIHQADCSGNLAMRMWFPLIGSSVSDLRFVEDGDQITVGSLTVSVLETPGHTQGSVCFAIGDELFTGDTLFQSSIGRTDLPGGDMGVMQKTLEALKNIVKNYTVYPGHGPKTTLDREKRVNPYMR